MSLLRKIKHWFRHDWEFAGGDWIIKDKVSMTTRRCKFCKLEQDIEHYHLIPKETAGTELNLGMAILKEERKAPRTEEK